MSKMRYYRYIDQKIKEDRKLICNVKFYPAIYNNADLSYCDKCERGRIWEIIAQNLQSTAQSCEERWHNLLEMYKRKPFSLHNALFEIMDQFLNMDLEPTNSSSKATGLTQENAEEQVDMEEMMNLEFVDITYLSVPEVCTFPVDDEKMSSELTDETFTSLPENCTFVHSFFETEDSLELYQDFPHSL